MRQLLEKLFTGAVLAKEEAAAALRSVASGEISPAQIASFLTVFRTREVAAQELAGFRSAMLELAIPLTTSEDVIDLCGTGGDGKNTFNISTAASFIVAASGFPVAKHGNYGLSSLCGSSNVLEHLKVPFAKDAEHARRQLEKAKITFLHAPLWHPAMKAVGPIRKELGFKTIFNILGPLVNPARPKYQLVGTHSLKLQELYAEILSAEGIEFCAVHSADGYDEISLTGNTFMATSNGTRAVTPESFGTVRLNPKSLECGESIPEYAATLQRVLEGNGTEAQHAAVAANAAAALALTRRTADLESLFGVALDTIRSGKGAKTLATLREIV